MDPFPGSFDLIVNSHEFDFGPFFPFWTSSSQKPHRSAQSGFQKRNYDFSEIFAIIQPSKRKSMIIYLNGFLYILPESQESQDMLARMKDISLDSSCKLKLLFSRIFKIRQQYFQKLLQKLNRCFLGE